jgi:hypothetical protein
MGAGAVEAGATGAVATGGGVYMPAFGSTVGVAVEAEADPPPQAPAKARRGSRAKRAGRELMPSASANFGALSTA